MTRTEWIEELRYMANLCRYGRDAGAHIFDKDAVLSYLDTQLVQAKRDDPNFVGVAWDIKRAKKAYSEASGGVDLLSDSILITAADALEDYRTGVA